VIGTMGVVSVGLAISAWVAAVDLARGHPRGWAVSLIIAFVALDAALTTVLTGDLNAPLLAGLTWTTATVIALLAPQTRREVGALHAPAGAWASGRT
jgi:hypothetical protein